MEYANLLFNTVKKTLSHSFIYGIGTSFMAVVGVILLPLYTRFLNPAEYGVYSLIGIVLTLLAFIYDFGMVNALFRWVYHYSAEEAVSRKKVISTTLIFLIGLASILTLILWQLAAHISQLIFKEASYALLIKLMLAGIFVQSLTWVPLSLLRIKERPLVFVSVVVSGLSLMIVANFILLSMGRGLKGIYESYVIAYIYMAGVLFYITRGDYSMDFSVKELKGMLKFGIPFLPVLFFSWIIDFSGRYFLGQLSSLQDVGLYSVGSKIGQVLYLAAKTFAVAWTPIMLSLSQNYMQNAPRIFGKVFTYFTLCGFMLFLIASVFGKEIIMILASPSYYSASRVVPLIALSYLLYGLYAYLLSGLIITKNVYVQPFILLPSAVINIALNIILIPRFGMMGSACATATSYLLITVATYYYAQKFYPIPVEFGRLGKILASSAAVYLLSYLINPPNLVMSLALKSALFAAFFYILYIVGFFHRAEIDKLKEIICKRGSVSTI